MCMRLHVTASTPAAFAYRSLQRIHRNVGVSPRSRSPLPSVRSTYIWICACVDVWVCVSMVPPGGGDFPPRLPTGLVR